MARNWVHDMPNADAYWADRVLYDVHHQPSHLDRFKQDADAYMAAVPLPANLKAAIRDNDIGSLYRAGVNPYLLRAHCLGMRMPEVEYLAALRAIAER